MPPIPILHTSHLVDQVLHALATLGAAVLLAAAVNWLLKRWVWRYVKKLPGDKAATLTRWRTLRRIVVGVILFIGIISALTNFAVTTTLARGVLASSAVLALIIGLAAQTTLSNFVSGILLSLNQPIRLGDRVTIDGQSGVIEEIGLSYTTLHADDGRRVIYPNSMLMSREIENATIGGGSGRAVVQVPVSAGTDADALCERLLVLAGEAGLGEPEAVVAQLTADGATIEVRGWADDWRSARTAEEQLRASALGARTELRT
jgi:small-conductance mechanosensitive channel